MNGDSGAKDSLVPAAFVTADSAPDRRARSLDEARLGLLVEIDAAAKRLGKRKRAVEGDLARGREAETAAEQARPFVAEAARAPRGTALLVATDWSSGEAQRRELLLDRARSPHEQLLAIFAEARRMKRGSVLANARLAETHAKEARLGALREDILAAPSLEALRTLCERAHREDPSLLPGLVPGAVRLGEPRTRPRRSASPRLPYRAFLSPSGGRILVGRGAADNDELTLHIARPYDLWLHVMGQRGAHVVVTLKRGHDAPAELMVDAAHLAVHFSDARGESIVDVTYAPRRFVRKRKGSPPGLVQVEREKTLVLRVDGARVRALLAREEAS